MKKLFESFRNINWKTVAVFVPVSLAFPVIRAIIADMNKLAVFSDVLFITACILIVIGIFFSFYKHGDFDMTKFVVKRALDTNPKDYPEYMKDQIAQRASLFNYPLFFGIVYLLLSIVTAFIADA